MVKHHRFCVEWINFVSHDRNHHLEKSPFVYKFVKANLLSKFTQLFNAVVCMVFLSNNIYCFLQMLNFDDQAAYEQ